MVLLARSAAVLAATNQERAVRLLCQVAEKPDRWSDEAAEDLLASTDPYSLINEHPDHSPYAVYMPLFSTGPFALGPGADGRVPWDWVKTEFMPAYQLGMAKSLCWGLMHPENIRIIVESELGASTGTLDYYAGIGLQLPSGGSLESISRSVEAIVDSYESTFSALPQPQPELLIAVNKLRI